MKNVSFHGISLRPLKTIIAKLKDICDHMLRWMRFEMKDLAWDLERGVGPCWKSQIKTSRLRWDNASADPASRVWPKPDDCDVMNEIENFESKFLSAKISEVLNPTGWANADGPPGPKLPDYSRRANFKDLDQQ